MGTTLYLKHMILRTPLETIAKRVKHAHALYDRRKYPELKEITMEPDRIEEALRRVLRKDSNCIDIGCHIGSFMSSILRWAPNGKHIAFEPVPEKAKWLRRKFPEAEIKEIALGASTEKRSFYQNLTQPGLSGLALGSVQGEDIRELTVECRRLDDVIPKDRKFTFIKIDTEGAELLVLDGARQTILRDRPFFLFESSYDGSGNLDLKREELFNFVVKELGYRVFKVQNFLDSGNELTLQQFQDALVFPFQALNFLAVPPNYSV